MHSALEPSAARGSKSTSLADLALHGGRPEERPASESQGRRSTKFRLSKDCVFLVSEPCPRSATFLCHVAQHIQCHQRREAFATNR